MEIKYTNKRIMNDFSKGLQALLKNESRILFNIFLFHGVQFNNERQFNVTITVKINHATSYY
jgi:hypothetical protein